MTVPSRADSLIDKEPGEYSQPLTKSNFGNQFLGCPSKTALILLFAAGTQRIQRGTMRNTYSTQ